MEVKVNNSIDIETPVKKKRPRISTGEKAADNQSDYVRSTNVANDNKKQAKPEFVKKDRKPTRSVEDIKAGIVKSLEIVGGKYVKFDDINHTEGLLVCGVVDPENENKVTAKDIYFAVVNHDRHLVYVNCNNRFSTMREPSLKCSILDWLYRNEANTILDIANSQMEYDGVEIFTPTYLVAPVVEKKQNKKNNKKQQNKKK